MTKRLIVSLTMIVLVLAGVAGATVAYYNSTASVLGSTFSTDTMYIQVDSNPDSTIQNWTDTFTVSSNYFINGLYPGFPAKSEHNWQVIDIRKVGNVDGDASIKFDVRAGTWSALVDNLVFTVSYSAANDNTWKPVASGTLAQFNGNTYPLGKITGTGGTDYKVASVKIVWSVPASAGNDIRLTQVVIDTVFGLEQTH